MSDCGHKHLRFVDGSFTIKCIDCDQQWDAVNERHAFNYLLKSKPLYAPADTRHDRWEMPRTEKLAPLIPSLLKKPKP